ncbi:MAG TPA: hypothetical protein VNO18_15980 [Xanthobacteraceae bacterium]|jgi:hypothetical protein|nr:hypothetical protein [Xanthobacteraceae bacterium]
MDRPGELALLGPADTGGGLRTVAEAILVMAPDGQRSEIALSVADAWQSKSLGTLLLGNLECRARMIGNVLRTNGAMKNLARKRVSQSEAPSRMPGWLRSLRICRVVCA